MNAIDMLTQQHTQVAKAFQRAQHAAGDEQATVLFEIAVALTIHNAIEEAYLYPAYRRYALPEAEDASLQEHQQIRDLIAQMMELPQNSPELPHVVGRLDFAMREHVGREEGELFPWLKARLTDEELDDIGNEMERLADVLNRKDKRVLLRMAENRESPLHPA